MAAAAAAADAAAAVVEQRKLKGKKVGGAFAMETKLKENKLKNN